MAGCDLRSPPQRFKRRRHKGEGLPGWEAFLDKAPGGDLLRVATGGRRGNSAKEKPPPFPVRVFQDKAPGGDLLLHGKATLPSAHARFTSEFGMGSGGTTPLWPPGKGWEQRECAGSTSS